MQTTLNPLLLALASLSALPALAAPGSASPPPLVLAEAPRAGEAVGLYPLALPPGQGDLAPRLAAWLHDGAASLPRVRAFDLIPRGACLPDEGGCLAAAARSAGLTQIVSAQVTQQPKGYGFTLRLFEAKDGAQRNEHTAQVQGGPLDLAGALEHGVCRLLGAAPCAGTATVRTGPDGCKLGAFAPKLFVDGVEAGALPLPKPLSLPIGRHTLRAGSGEERRVRVSYGRETRLVCEVRAGLPELAEDLPDVAPMKVARAPVQALSAQAPQLTLAQASGRLFVAAGVALLAVSAGAGFYAKLQANTLDGRYHAGALTDADKPSYTSVNRAGALSLAAGAAGGAAIVTGAAVLLFAPASSPGAPAGVAVQGRF